MSFAEVALSFFRFPDWLIRATSSFH